MRLRLPDRRHIVVTGETDPIARHYQPLVGFFMNRRLRDALILLGDRRFGKLLDAGCGGGVFFPELARRCDELHGVDLHDYLDQVAAMARAEGIQVTLHRSDITHLDLPSDSFDCVVCISVLEFVKDVRAALGELARVARPGAPIIVGVPVEHVITRLGYRLARTPDPRAVHRSDYRAIMEAATTLLEVRRMRRFPVFVPLQWALYATLELAKA